MPDDPARLELTRSGGFAGLRRTAQIDLDAGEAEALAAAFDEAGEQPDRAKGADRFQYDLTLVRGAERRSVCLREDAVPDALRPVVHRLTHQLD
jgi:hypothetical protein